MSRVRVSRLRQVRDESRDVLLSHAEPQVSVRLVKVGTGGVDRTTGEPLMVFYEITTKVRGHAEVIRTFSHERNARIAYLMAQSGIVDFSTPLGDIGPRLWQEPKNMTALAALDSAPARPRTRMDTGDSHVDLEDQGEVRPSPLAMPTEPRITAARVRRPSGRSIETIAAPILNGAES